MTKIDRRLHLVMEIPRGDGSPLMVHSTALPLAIFEQYFDLCGPTMNYLMVGGFGNFAPRYAALAFRQVAQRSIGPEMPDDKERYQRAKFAVEQRVNAFFAELGRLTFVFLLKGAKWEQVPLEEARSNGMISADEVSRIEAATVFFTLASESVPPEIREAILGGLSMFSARAESSSTTDFHRFLQTSMKNDSSGERKDALQSASPGSPEKDSGSTSASTERISHIVRRPTSAPGISIGSPRPSGH